MKKKIKKKKFEHVISTDYLGKVYRVTDYIKIINKMVTAIRKFQKRHKFDAIAFTGTSGASMAYPLSLRLKLPLICVRKNDRNHFGYPIEGCVTADNYIIVDDFISDGWEYNDEVYTPTEGGHPEKVFTDKAKAEQKCQELNLEEFKGLFVSEQRYHSTIKDYGYGYDEMLEDSETADDFCREHFDTSFVSWWHDCDLDTYNDLYEDITDEQWAQFMSCFNLNFWEVVAVEKGD